VGVTGGSPEPHHLRGAPGDRPRDGSPGWPAEEAGRPPASI